MWDFAGSGSITGVVRGFHPTASWRKCRESPEACKELQTRVEGSRGSPQRSLHG